MKVTNKHTHIHIYMRKMDFVLSCFFIWNVWLITQCVVCDEVYYTLIWPGGYLSPLSTWNEGKNVKKTAHCLPVLFFIVINIWSWILSIFLFLLFSLRRDMLKQQQQPKQNTTWKIKKMKIEKQKLMFFF